MSAYDNAKRTLDAMIAAEATLNAELAQLDAVVIAAVNSDRFAPIDHMPEWLRGCNGRLFKAKHLEWGRKMDGVMNGYKREMDGAVNAFRKNRDLGFDQADLTVGTGESFAKAVQFKNTISVDSKVVDAMIAKAANQLTGETNETPLPTQRKIIEVTVAEQGNWWPIEEVHLRQLSGPPEEAGIPLGVAKAHGENRVWNALSNYAKKKRGLNLATQASLVSPGAPAAPGISNYIHNPHAGPRSSSRVVPGGQATQVLTVKVSFVTPRIFGGPNNTTVHIRKMLFHATIRNGTMVVEAEF